MPVVLQSRTIAGLLIVLLVACGFAAAGKLTTELKDVLIFVYGAFSANRVITNVAETRQAPK